MLLAGASSGSIEPRARLDRQVRGRSERLAKVGSGVSMRIAVFAFFLTLAPLFGAEEKLTGGNGTLYIGGRPNRVLVIDEATEKVVGEIHTKTGTPAGL